MSKKNKDIEVVAEESVITYMNQKIKATEFKVGKRTMGYIIHVKDGFDVVIDMDNPALHARTYDEAVETLIREWNLIQP